ncbi:MAG: hypothetical protein HY894_08575 [Deltaproteobacteria bacterium]|nr:hypothetical protein [Deltaproteobacteria bacterium]
MFKRYGTILLFLLAVVLMAAGGANASDRPRLAAGSGHTVFIKSDGSLWAWGSNAYGQIGDGTTVDKSRPVRVGADNDWATVSAGDGHTAAIKTGGTLWT